MDFTGETVETRTVHECLFCSQTFGSAVEKDDHILEHFAQKVCTECDQNLIRIGGRLYTVHNDVTCIRQGLKNEQHADAIIEDIPFAKECEQQQKCSGVCSIGNFSNSINQKAADSLIYFEEGIEIKSEPSTQCEEDLKPILDPNNFGESNMQLDEQIPSISGLNDAQTATSIECENNLIENAKNGNTKDKNESNISQSENPQPTNASEIQNWRKSVIRDVNKRSVCTICGLTTHKHSLRRHKIKYHNIVATKSGHFQCNICQKTLAEEKTIYKHIQDEHAHLNTHKPYSTRRVRPITDETKRTSCDICGASLHRSSLAVHRRMKHNVIEAKIVRVKNKHSECTICGKIIQSMYKHRIKKHNIVKTKTGQFQCKICQMTLVDDEDIKEHIQKEHAVIKFPHLKSIGTVSRLNDQENQDELVNDLHLNKRPITDEKMRTKCEICGKTIHKRSLYAHQKNVHNVFGTMYCPPGTIICKICGTIFPTQEELIAHKTAVHEHRIFECYICKKRLKSRKNLRGHMVNKHGDAERKFKCHICGFMFLHKTYLEKHINLVHLDIRNFVCTYCGNACKSKILLQYHVYQHTGERPFKCDVCGKGFRTPPGKVEHMRVHTKEKPFRCPVEECGQQFSFGVDFRRHKYKVHGIFTNKYPCTICNEIFPENSLLKKHMQKYHHQTEEQNTSAALN